MHSAEKEKLVQLRDGLAEMASLLSEILGEEKCAEKLPEGQPVDDGVIQAEGLVFQEPVKAKTNGLGGLYGGPFITEKGGEGGFRHFIHEDGREYRKEPLTLQELTRALVAQGVVPDITQGRKVFQDYQPPVDVPALVARVADLEERLAAREKAASVAVRI